MTEAMKYCEERITMRHGKSYMCGNQAKFTVRRKSDADRKRVCGTHKNQAKRFGWIVVAGLEVVK
jgi:hypothetical protein